MSYLLSNLYVLALSGMSIYGLMGLLTVWLYWRHRHERFPTPHVPESELPPVTVQLPLYNEQYVITRLVEAAVSLNYPRHLLQIQVIDDSTDATTVIAEKLVARYREQGINITLLHRTRRAGYKAGALANALPQATGQFIAIFDADFIPPADFLRRAMPHFCRAPRLGVVQARWGHLNDTESPLTAAQAIALDMHFSMEQAVRHRANLFPKFNGAAGVWRRTCIEDAGGWKDDTVCEDLCLSTRAVLKKWEFRYLHELAAPAELPGTISAFKVQQARWAKGSMQCLLQYGRSILKTSDQTVTARLYALLSMSMYTAHLLLIVLLLLQIPLLYLDHQFSALLGLFSIAAVGQPLLFVLAQRVLYRDWWWRLRHLPTLLLIAIGLAPSTSRAILAALAPQQHHPFTRTPKRGAAARTYRLPFDWIVLLEISLALYAALGIALEARRGHVGPLFLFLCLFGFGYVAFLSLRERFNGRNFS